MKEAKKTVATKATVETETTIPVVIETPPIAIAAIVGGTYSAETSPDFTVDVHYQDGKPEDFAPSTEAQLCALEDIKRAVNGLVSGRESIIAAVKAAMAIGVPIALIRHTLVNEWIARGGSKSYANELMLVCGIRLRAKRSDAGKSKGNPSPVPGANPKPAQVTVQAPAVPGPVVTPPSGNAASVETPVVGTATVETPVPTVNLETVKDLTPEEIGKAIGASILAQYGKDKAKEVARHVMATIHQASA